VDTLISFLAGFTVFSAIGILAHQLNTAVDNVVASSKFILYLALLFHGQSQEDIVTVMFVISQELHNWLNCFFYLHGFVHIHTRCSFRQLLYNDI